MTVIVARRLGSRPRHPHFCRLTGTCAASVNFDALHTYERLRAGLGLVAPASVLIPPPQPHGLMEDHLRRLAACLVATRATTLAALAEALAITIPAVREGIASIGDRLAAVGMRTIENGAEVRLYPLPSTDCAVATITTVEPVGELSTEQVAILCIVAYHGTATKSVIEHLRREDSETLLRRLVARGLLDRALDPAAVGGPYVYSLTARALGAMGHPTLESLQAYLAQAVDARGAVALSEAAAGAWDLAEAG